MLELLLTFVNKILAKWSRRKGVHASHAQNISRATVLRTHEQIKVLAVALGEAPVNLVQQATAYVSASSGQHLPSDEALRQIGRRKRKADCPHEQCRSSRANAQQPQMAVSFEWLNHMSKEHDHRKPGRKRMHVMQNRWNLYCLNLAIIHHLRHVGILMFRRLDASVF